MGNDQRLSIERGAAALDALAERRRAAEPAPLAVVNAVPPLDWPPPVLFDTLMTPEIPASLLPDPVGRYVDALAAHTETPPALGVVVALAVLSTATRGCVRVELDDGHHEPANLYLAAVQQSGSRKTAVFSRLTEPLTRWERAQAETLKPEIARLRSKRRSEEAVIEQRRRKLHSFDDAVARNQEIADIAEAEAKLTPVPALPKLYANDSTPESLAAALDEQGQVFAVLSDEGGIFDVLAGLYSNGVANVDVVLKGWDRGPCRIRRRDREIDMNPCLTLGLAVQPATLGNFASKKSFQGRGMAERILFAVPVSTLGFRKHDKPAPSPQLVDAYGDAIGAILNNNRARTLTLSDEAERDLRDFRRRIEAMLRPGKKLAEFAGWGSKLPGQLARVAGLLHLIEQPQADAIAGRTMTRALDLGALLIEHALAAFIEMGMDGATADARRCWTWIEGRATFTRGALTLAMRHVMNAERITAALRVLAGRNLIDGEHGIPSPGTRERTFRVNPRTGGRDGLA